MKTIQWHAEDRPCPLCKSKRTKILGRRGGHAHRDAKGIEAVVVECIDCNHVYTRPTLIPESNPYAEHSPEEYFHDQRPKVKVLAGEELATHAELILGRPGRMLELGCGEGWALVAAARRGWSVFGVEMTESFARVARSQGIFVECAAIENCTLPDQKYDVILLPAVLEHLYEPMETLKRVHNALRPGGLLFIDVPNELSLAMRMGNLYMRLRGRDWVVNLSPTFPPYHVVGFSPESLRYALNSAGFIVHKLSVVKWNNDLPKARCTWDTVERMGLSVVQFVGRWLGMGDGIVCWAVRN